MMRTGAKGVHKRGYRGKKAVELLEEATGLVRGASARDLCCYYIGSLPFVFFLLSFCAGMAGPGGSYSRLVLASLILSLLFIWMKCWQAVYAHRLWARLRNLPPAPVSPARLAAVQGSIHPWGVIVLPVAFLLTLPFGWCHAFFQNVTVFGGEGDIGTVRRKAVRQASLFQGQNLAVMLVFAALSLVLLVNLLAAFWFIPFLLKTLLGIETPFTRSFHLLLNSTVLASLAAMTYLIVDPLVKAVYVLRCFHGEALESGADLLTELRSLRRTSGRTVALLLAGASLLTALTSLPASAASGPAVPVRGGTEAGELDRAIVEVLKRPEFYWPSDRKVQKKEAPPIPGFLSSLGRTLKDWALRAGRWIGKAVEWIAERFFGRGEKQKAPDRRGFGRGWMVNSAMYLLLAAILSFCGVALWRRFGKGKRREASPSPPAEAIVPDLRDESVTAEALSTDRWRELADELLAAGETRLALRALYFACIALLSEAGLLVMDRAKSDLDYERELRRRAHSMPSLPEAFAENMAIFQRTWYGRHETEGETVELFLANYRRIASHEA